MNELSPSGLYVHVPFCASKCPYCEFVSVANESLIPVWLDAACHELKAASPMFQTIQTVYIGGGTPSRLDSTTLSHLMNAIRSRFTIQGNAEITIEANPEDISPERLHLWREIGVTRISLGVQALNNRDLSFLGRRHTAHTSLLAIGMIREHSSLLLNIDLMFGLPGQSTVTWLKSLKQAVTLQPDHISCYQLNPAPGTLLMKRIASGRVHPISDSRERRLFRMTSHVLRNHHYIHYEISNFARNASSLCRHNLNYWNHTPYLGIGPAAHSFDGHRRWWNVKSITSYARKISTSGTAVEESETLNTTQLALEALALGIRTDRGVSQAIIQMFDPDLVRTQSLIQHGLLEIKNQVIHTTLNGFCIADRLPLDIIGNSLEYSNH